MREEALFRGYTVVDPQTVITTHLTEIIKDNMPELLSYAETQKLLDELDQEQQKLIADMIPEPDRRGRPAAGAAEPAGRARLDPRPADHPGRHLGGLQLYPQRHRHHRTRARPPGAPDLQRDSSTRRASSPWSRSRRSGSRASPRPSSARATTGSSPWRPSASCRSSSLRCARTFERHAMMGETPPALTSPGIRPYVRSIVERFRPDHRSYCRKTKFTPRSRSRPWGRSDMDAATGSLTDDRRMRLKTFIAHLACPKP